MSADCRPAPDVDAESFPPKIEAHAGSYRQYINRMAKAPGLPLPFTFASFVRPSGPGELAGILLDAATSHQKEGSLIGCSTKHVGYQTCRLGLQHAQLSCESISTLSIFIYIDTKAANAWHAHLAHGHVPNDDVKTVRSSK